MRGVIVSGVVLGTALVVSCATSAPLSLQPRSVAPAAASSSAAAKPPPALHTDENAELARAYREELEKHPNLDFAGFTKLAKVKRAPAPALGFDPKRVRYYEEVARAFVLTPAEEATFQKNGFVSVDHGQRYSMGSAYYAIYTRDLPVLVTTDSILHAFHRSYDDVLKELEKVLFVGTIERTLKGIHDELEKSLAASNDAALKPSVGDVDLFVTVARNLLAGAGVSGTKTLRRGVESWNKKLLVASRTGKDAEALKLLEAVAALGFAETAIFGGHRPIDFTQFAPRGHYEDDLELRRYFRTLMWLGRADLGWCLSEPDKKSGLVVDVARERRDAFLFASLAKRAGVLPPLGAMSSIIDFMVGSSDNVSVGALVAALESAKATEPAALASESTMKQAISALQKAKPRVQQIRSQGVFGDAAQQTTTQVPLSFQVFGQRFLLDSFVLSNVVYDSIHYHGEEPERAMPNGLDVAAALGNDEAVFFDKAEIDKFKHGSNLLALRRVIEKRTPQAWNATLYDGWLDVLRQLDDVPAGHFPAVMRSNVWQRKQLQTFLSSWAELRHDTLLYGKQSYTAMKACEYPEGFVEPYPAVFAGVGQLAKRASALLAAADVSHPDPKNAATLTMLRDRQVKFFDDFAGVTAKLEKLAKKELNGEPFETSEQEFLKQTIDIRGGGSGPPTYSGWYPGLFYGRGPADHKPTVADVHSVPPSDLDAEGHVLEAGVGDAHFLIVAIDNEGDRAVYVGPVYSYYEFTRPITERMTDSEWSTTLASGKLPARPLFVRAFTAARSQRTLGPPAKPR